MKNSPLPTILLMVLAVLAVWSVILCWNFLSESREVRNLREQANSINYRQAGVNQLVNEVVEYSKKNHEIDPILKSIGLTNKPAK